MTRTRKPVPNRAFGFARKTFSARLPFVIATAAFCCERASGAFMLDQAGPFAAGLAAAMSGSAAASRWAARLRKFPISVVDISGLQYGDRAKRGRYPRRHWR